MKVSDFDYNLPKALIANHPPKLRGTSNLLVLNKTTGEIKDKKYGDILDYLNPGDVMVLNDTKVMKSRIIAKKENGAKRELVILEKHSDNNWFKHQVLHRGRISKGDKLFIDDNEIIVEEILGNGIALVSSKVDLINLSETYGKPPLPPYMKRDATKEDIKRYQTVFARDPGSAAAPTASLNMTNDILEKLRKKGVTICYITLHVGLGTFLPIRSEKVEDHKIHSEYFIVPKRTLSAINQAKQSKNNIVAVGTTVTRTLEYVFTNKLTSNSNGDVSGEADIYIYPGYNFKCVDVLLTNFHAPKSTVLMLASAFAGKDNLQKAYIYAIKSKYNFLSYGDSMLIL